MIFQAISSPSGMTEPYKAKTDKIFHITQAPWSQDRLTINAQNPSALLSERCSLSPSADMRW